VWLSQAGRGDSDKSYRYPLYEPAPTGRGCRPPETHVSETKSLLLGFLASTWTRSHQNRLLYGHAARAHVRLPAVWYLRRKGNPLPPSGADSSKPASLADFAPRVSMAVCRSRRPGFLRHSNAQKCHGLRGSWALRLGCRFRKVRGPHFSSAPKHVALAG